MSPEKEIRAYYTNDFIRVYQAYNNAIAESAIRNNNFISPPFKSERTTWIKPSFLWMMYRSGWATKENQERILAIDISHQGFRWALGNSCLSHFEEAAYESKRDWLEHKNKMPVIIQWDPERDLFLRKLNYRTIQIGLKPPAVKRYTSEWIIKISDVTPLAQKIKHLIENQNKKDAMQLLPEEWKYFP